MAIDVFVFEKQVVYSQMYDVLIPYKRSVRIHGIRIYTLSSDIPAYEDRGCDTAGNEPSRCNKDNAEAPACWGWGRGHNKMWIGYQVMLMPQEKYIAQN